MGRNNACDKDACDTLSGVHKQPRGNISIKKVLNC